MPGTTSELEWRCRGVCGGKKGEQTLVKFTRGRGATSQMDPRYNINEDNFDLTVTGVRLERTAGRGARQLAWHLERLAGAQDVGDFPPPLYTRPNPSHGKAPQDSGVNAPLIKMTQHLMAPSSPM